MSAPVIPLEQFVRSRAVVSRKPTPTQMKIMHRIVAGRSSKEIAREMQCSVKTIDKHRSDIYRKLGIHNVAQMIKHVMAAAPHCITCTCHVEPQIPEDNE